MPAASYLIVSARAALVIPCDGELLELLVKSSIDLSADFLLSVTVPPFSTAVSTSKLQNDMMNHVTGRTSLEFYTCVL